MAYDRISRRHFFYGSLLAGAMPAAGFGSAPSLKLLGYKSPNEKLNIASIGAGGKAASDIIGCDTENIVALTDPDAKRAERMFKKYEKAPKYADFRRMLDKEGKKHRCRDRSDSRLHARNRDDVGDRARKACLLPEAAHTHRLGSPCIGAGGREI